MERKGDSRLHVFYGANHVALDVTFDVLQKCCQGSTIFIPGTNDKQDKLFSDPLVGTIKHITIQENERQRVFEPNTDIEYTFELNGELFKHAQQLRKQKNLPPVDFAMQLVMNLYCNVEQGPVLKIGAKYDVPQQYLSSHVPIVVVEHDVERCVSMTNNHKHTDVNHLMIEHSAFAYAPAAIVKSKVVALESIFPQHQIVTLHNDRFVDVKSEDANPLQDSYGCSRTDLAKIQDTNHVVYATLVFDSDTSLVLALQQAAPRLLLHATTVIVCCNKQRTTNISYIDNTMRTFRFNLRNQFVYRAERVFQVWTL